MNSIILIPVMRAVNRQHCIQSYYKLISYCGNEEELKHKIKAHNLNEYILTRVVM
jgi:hypothetical protein